MHVAMEKLKFMGVYSFGFFFSRTKYIQLPFNSTVYRPFRWFMFFLRAEKRMAFGQPWPGFKF